MRPPRALHCEFPLGRPFGRPGDPAFQLRVLEAALELLSRPSGPVLEEFPETITEDLEPVACAVPPRFDPSLPPAVDEAIALRGAYERWRSATGRTAVGRVMDADGVPDALGSLIRIAEGTSLEAAGLPGEPRLVAADLRAYYEEAAMALAGHVPAARQAESWFVWHTEAGEVLRRAQTALRDSGAGMEVWFYLVPAPQQRSGDWAEVVRAGPGAS
jgi:hypothetical protein